MEGFVKAEGGLVCFRRLSGLAVLRVWTRFTRGRRGGGGGL